MYKQLGVASVILLSATAMAQAETVEMTCPSVESANIRLLDTEVSVTQSTRQKIPHYFSNNPRAATDIRISAKKFIRALISYNPNQQSVLTCIYSRTDKNRTEYYLSYESVAINCWPTQSSDDNYRIFSNRSLSCSASPEECSAMCEVPSS